jgi:hypothetical protein
LETILAGVPICKCSAEMRRMKREGFWEEKVFSRFGFFPWECPVCRVRRRIRDRGKRISRKRTTKAA